jgi:hypothetical protein
MNMEINKEKFETVVTKILKDFGEQMLQDTKGKGANISEASIRDTAMGRVDTLLWLGLINLKEWTALVSKIMDVYMFHVNYVNPDLKAAYTTEEVTSFRKITPADIRFPRRPA